MRFFRRLLLLIVVLIPLATLVHKNDLGRWDIQRSAMAGPDEFSYLLMADNFLKGGGLSLLHTLGRDTFYPPGFPLLLASWGKLFGLTAFTAHALNAVLLCVDTFLAWWIALHVLTQLLAAAPGQAPFEHRRFILSGDAIGWLALLVAAAFAGNWHVLETSLLIMSEPAFMLVTFGWVALALRLPGWHLSLWRTGVLATLAVLAWSVRGAGIVCVAATFLFAVGNFLNAVRAGVWHGTPVHHWHKRIVACLLVLAIAAAYQVTLTRLSPEKSVAAGRDSANSYPKQLLNGLTDGGAITLTDPRHLPALLSNVTKLVLGHFNDYASAFVPWPRENPDFHFRDVAGKCLGLFGLLGWLWHLVRPISRRPPDAPESTAVPPTLSFLFTYLFLYFTLYLVWPFNFARFWSPILPFMLVFAADALVRFVGPRRGLPPPFFPILLLFLSATLSLVEDAAQLGNYARRLNYVSDALADTARAVVRRSPDATHTYILVMGGDQHFTWAWYFSQVAPGKGYIPRSPLPHVAAKNGGGETVEELVLRTLSDAATLNNTRIFLLSYFEHADARGVLTNLSRSHPDIMAHAVLERVTQKEIVAAAWELKIDPAVRPGVKIQKESAPGGAVLAESRDP